MEYFSLVANRLILSKTCHRNLVIGSVFGYNKGNLKCSTTLVCFEPTDTLNGIPTSSNGCQASTHMRIAEEDKSLFAVTHLALLGVKRQEPTFWGYKR